MTQRKIQGVINSLRIRPKRKATWDLSDIGEELAKVSTLDTGDAMNFGYKLFEIIVDGVNEGIAMKLGKLCTITVSCDTDGNVKPSLRAMSQLRTALKSYEGEFKNSENKGLDEDGFAKKWLEEHPDDTVEMRDGTIRTPADYGL
ncbi:MAG: hypothetical protein GY845_07130 [Planctomycetes bacterium]|nr:hypothetical protein [Planctomycetota bacterium]